MAEIKQNKTFHETLMRGDKYIWGIYLWLIIYSIVETFSASSALISRTAAGNDLVLNHINYLLVGFGAIVLFQHLKLSSIRNWGFFLFALGIFLYLLLPFFGTRHQGAIRDIWGIQPSELIICNTSIRIRDVSHRSATPKSTDIPIFPDRGRLKLCKLCSTRCKPPPEKP